MFLPVETHVLAAGKVPPSEALRASCFPPLPARDRPRWAQPAQRRELEARQVRSGPWRGGKIPRPLSTVRTWSLGSLPRHSRDRPSGLTATGSPPPPQAPAKRPRASLQLREAKGRARRGGPAHTRAACRVGPASSGWGAGGTQALLRLRCHRPRPRPWFRLALRRCRRRPLARPCALRPARPLRPGAAGRGSDVGSSQEFV